MDNDRIMSPATGDATDPKKAWQAPVIEELDLAATEVGPIYGVPIDAAIYTV